MPSKKKERGRPMKRRLYPPRIDAAPEVIANVVLNVKSPARFGNEPKRTEYAAATATGRWPTPRRCTKTAAARAVTRPSPSMISD